MVNQQIKWTEIHPNSEALLLAVHGQGVGSACPLPSRHIPHENSRALGTALGFPLFTGANLRCTPAALASAGLRRARRDHAQEHVPFCQGDNTLLVLKHRILDELRELPP